MKQYKVNFVVGAMHQILKGNLARTETMSILGLDKTLDKTTTSSSDIFHQKSPL